MLLGFEAFGFVLVFIASIKLNLRNAWFSKGVRSVGWEGFDMVEPLNSFDGYRLNGPLGRHFLDTGSLHPINLIYNFGFQKAD